MNAAKHTPGPWPIERRGTSITAIGPCVADEYAGSAWLDVSEADALLIAAAPDLLAALTRLCRSFPTDADMKEAGWEGPEIEEGCNAYDAARSAVAKATGEAS